MYHEEEATITGAIATADQPALRGAAVEIQLVSITPRGDVGITGEDP